jgi:hypothetical protein
MKSQKRTFLFLSKLMFSGIFFTLLSCSTDDAVPVNEEELLTTVEITLTSNGQQVVLVSKDLDGDGPNEPVFTTTGNIMANTIYQGNIRFLNEAEIPAEDKTLEIAAEDFEHQVFYQLSSGLGSVAYTDADENGNPIGLSFTYSSGNIGSGNLTVILRHLLDKNAPGVADGLIENAGGSTDIQVVFPISIN